LTKVLREGAQRLLAGAVEAEPDVVLVAHPEAMGEALRRPVRKQHIRTTPDGPAPLGID
jgi:hypothetical protein